MSNFYSGWVSRVRIYPIALPVYYIATVYQREHSWLGRIINDVEAWILRRILKDKAIKDA